jgi:serine/threonine protein kinase
VSLTEAHVKGYMQQILTGIAYLHGRKIMHR